jgi:hypothetical protein
VIGVFVADKRFPPGSRFRRLEEDRERTVGDLRNALDDVKTVSGLLPICSSCRRVRDDKGSGEQINSSLQKHFVVPGMRRTSLSRHPGKVEEKDRREMMHGAFSVV